MLHLILMAALSCPILEVKNTSGKPIDNYDIRLAAHYSRKCNIDFPKTSPCLVKFFKEKDQHYVIRCGRANKRNEDKR